MKLANCQIEMGTNPVFVPSFYHDRPSKGWLVLPNERLAGVVRGL